MPNIRDWLQSNRSPDNYYELLGLPLFDPDQVAVLAAIRSSLREVMSRQGNADGSSAGRVVWLQRELGRAESTFTHPEKLAAYREVPAAQLRAKLDVAAPEWRNWSPARVFDWLRREGGVHEGGLELAARLVRSAPGKPSEAPFDTIPEAADAGSSVQDLPDSNGGGGSRGRVFGERSKPPAAAAARPSAAPAGVGGTPPVRRANDGVAPSPARPQSVPRAPTPDRRPAPAETEVLLESLDELQPVGGEPVGDRSMRRAMFALGGLGAAAAVVLLAAAVWVRNRNTASSAVEPRPPESPGFSTSPAPRPSAPFSAPPPAAVGTPTSFFAGSSQVADRSPSAAASGTLPAMGRTVEYLGSLEQIWGLNTDDGVELHLAVRLDDSPAEASCVEAVTDDAHIAHDLLDYVTWDEVSQGKPSAERRDADRVRLTGVRVDPADAATFRLAYASDGILLRLTSIERTDSPRSRVVVGSRRAKDTFAAPPADRALVGLLRTPTITGPEMPLKGFFRGYIDESDSALISPWQADFGAEVSCAKADVARLSPGDEVELTAAPTGIAWRRVLGGKARMRPYLVGTGIRRPGELPASGSSPTTASPAAAPGVAATTRNFKGTGEAVMVTDRDGPAGRMLLDGQWHSFSTAGKVPATVYWTYVDRRRRTWLGGEGGVSCYDGPMIRTYGTADGLPEQRISHLAEDSQGRLWATSHGGGVAAWDGSRWRRYSGGDGLEWPDHNGSVEDAGGRIWSAGGGPGVELTKPLVYQFDEPSGRFTVDKDWTNWRLPVMSIDGDREGTVFLGCIGGVFKIDPRGTVGRLTVDEGLPQRTAQALFLDSKERLWAGTWGGGIVEIDPKTLTVRKASALPEAGEVTRIAEQSDGTLWAATAGQGVWKRSASQWEKASIPGLPDAASTLVATLPAETARRLIGQAVAAAIPTGAGGMPPAPEAPPSSPPSTPLLAAGGDGTDDSVDLPDLEVSDKPLPLLRNFCRPGDSADLSLHLGVATELVPAGLQYRLEPDPTPGAGRRWDMLAVTDKKVKTTVARLHLDDGSLSFRWLTADSTNENLRNTVLFSSHRGPLMLRRKIRIPAVAIDTLQGTVTAALGEAAGAFRTEGLRWQVFELNGFPQGVRYSQVAVRPADLVVVAYDPGGIELEWRLQMLRQADELKCRYTMIAVEGKKTQSVTAAIIDRERQSIIKQVAEANKRMVELKAAGEAMDAERAALGTSNARILDFNRRINELNLQISQWRTAVQVLEKRNAVYEHVVQTVDAMRGRAVVKLRVFFKCNGAEFDLVRAE
jgi:hypothetical protein